MSNKIDSLVAEKVMEWVRHPRNTAHWVEGGRDPFMAPVMGLVPECGTGAWSPSTSISAAWAVRCELVARGFDVTVGSHGGLGNLTDDTCEITGDEDADERWTAGATSAPLAICLAALKAVGVPESAIQEALQ